jgi:hypothetical protein
MTMDRRTVLTIAAGGFVLAASPPARAVPTDHATFNMPAVVKAAATALREQYVDPDVANQLADLLLANLAQGAYDGISDPVKLAGRLTDDLRALVHDLHLSVQYDPAVPHLENAAVVAEDDLHPRVTGWGVQTVARLPGNIGLLRVTHFPSPPKLFADRYAAAIDLLQDTSALILDMTVNHGGGTDTAGFFLSYFLDGGIVVSRSVSRDGGTEVITTDTNVPGPRYGIGRPMFVAISGNTFSAGEGIAAQLSARKRATLVGARTRGGGHIGNFVKLPDGFQIFVVMGKSLDHNWEGVGVEPDAAVEPEFAVATAYRMALEGLLSQAADPKLAQVLRNVRDHKIENLSSFML